MRLAACLFAIAVLASAHAPPIRAETVDVSNDPGGFMGQYDTRWRNRAAKGVSVRISGMCASACTILLHHIPREKICVTAGARLGFHTASHFSGTDQLLDYYPSDIRSYIIARGGLSPSMMWLTTPEIFKFFRRC